jgi:hypothetical protein
MYIFTCNSIQIWWIVGLRFHHAIMDMDLQIIFEYNKSTTYVTISSTIQMYHAHNQNWQKSFVRGCKIDEKKNWEIPLQEIRANPDSKPAWCLPAGRFVKIFSPGSQEINDALEKHSMYPQADQQSSVTRNSQPYCTECFSHGIRL